MLKSHTGRNIVTSHEKRKGQTFSIASRRAATKKRRGDEQHDNQLKNQNKRFRPGKKAAPLNKGGIAARQIQLFRVSTKHFAH
jgi:hypothetical protein